jgi:gliding motility-associated-like protein
MNTQLLSQKSITTYKFIKNARTTVVSMVVFLCLSVSYGQTTIPCANGALNDTYCYTANDVTQLVYTSDTGLPLRLTFNEGTVELNFDEVIVLDTDGVTNLNAGDPYGNAGDLTGFVFESTGDTITIQVTSDGVASCIDGLFVPLDYDINCLTCTDPTIVFTNDGMCETGQQFTIGVDITDMGSSTNITVTDDQGNPPQSTTTPSVLNFGPYPAMAGVIFTIETGDLNCDFTSEIVECQAQGSCDILDAGADVFVDCETLCVDIIADYIALPNLDTTSYLIQGPICDLPPLTGGTPTNLTIDDQWSNLIALPFEFNFYGNPYTNVVAGANGQLSFNAGLSGNFNGWNIDPADMIPSNDANFPENTIFGAYHDIDPSVNPNADRINYFVTGTAPFRIFVLNFNEVPQFGCNELLTTQQILLYESLNVIDVNIVNKPVCLTWNDGLAVLGLQGNDLTEFSVPEDRNVGPWEATAESWRFVPNGAPINASVFEWRDSAGTVLGNDAILNVCPDQTTVYSAVLVVELPDGTFDELTDTVTVSRESGCSPFDCTLDSFLEDFGTGVARTTHPFTQLEFNATTQLEVNQYAVTNISSGLNFGWHQGMEDNTSGDTNGRMIFFNPSEDSNQTELYRRDVAVTANTSHIFDFAMTTVYDIDSGICSGTGTDSRLIYQIEDVAGTVLATSTTGNVPNGANPNWIRYSLEFNPGANTTIQVVLLNDIFGSCGNDLALDDLRIRVEGTTPTIQDPMDMIACEETPGSEIATFDLTTQNAEILDGQNAASFEITFHNTQADSDTGDNPIATPNAYPNISNPETIFVRVQRLNQNDCFSTTSFDLNVEAPFVITTNLPSQLEVCANEDVAALDATPTNSGIDLSTVSYEWTDPSGAVVSTDAIYSPPISGIYMVKISVPPCSETTVTIDIIVKPVPDLDLGEDVTLCDGEDFEITPIIVGDLSGATFLWSTGASDTSIIVTQSGTYSLDITTVDGCVVTDSIVVVISDPVIVTVDDSFEVCPDYETTITATSSDSGVTYEWFANGTLIDNKNESTLVILLPKEGPSLVEYSVVVTNSDGCMGTAIVEVSLYTNNENCVISQGISPNGDGMNDELDLTFLNNRTGINSFKIFNRNGREVYEFTNYTNQWVGQTNDGDELPTGTYYYVLGLNGEDPVFGSTYTGWVYINREKN